MERPDNSSAATTVLATLACGAAVTALGPVLRPFLVAVFLFYAIQSATKWLARLGLGLTAASISIMALAAIFATLFAQLAYREAGVFLGKWPKYEQRIEALLDRMPLPGSMWPAAATAQAPVGKTATVDPDGGSGSAEGEDASAAGKDTASPTSEPPSLLQDFVRSGARTVIDHVFRQSLDAAELLLLVLIYLLFLSLGRRQLPARITRAFPGERSLRLLAIGEGIGASMEKFMTVKTTVGVGMAVSAAAIMAGFGVDHWLLWAFLFFAANYVTYIGSMAACVPPILIAFLDLKSPAGAAIVAGLLVANRLAWIDFVEVRLAGRELNLDPVLVFLWLAYWGWAWGVVGLLLAYPMLAAVKIVLSHVQGWEGWAVLLGDR